uniref:DENN domain containing 2D n=1 Tax=Canis lupus familiaris TaxID=9615 RepID=A0A8C0SGB4_CANLF
KAVGGFPLDQECLQLHLTSSSSLAFGSHKSPQRAFCSLASTSPWGGRGGITPTWLICPRTLWRKGRVRILGAPVPPWIPKSSPWLAGSQGSVIGRGVRARAARAQDTGARRVPGGSEGPGSLDGPGARTARELGRPTDGAGAGALEGAGLRGLSELRAPWVGSPRSRAARQVAGQVARAGCPAAGGGGGGGAAPSRTRVSALGQPAPATRGHSRPAQVRRPPPRGKAKVRGPPWTRDARPHSPGHGRARPPPASQPETEARPRGETFSFVLTNVDGSRKIGYCRRLLPAGRGPRLPKVYCIISCIGCFGLFSKILDEVEKRHQISMAVIYPFMQGLREAAFPAPGKTVTLKSFIPDSGTEFISLTRPLDSHLEHVDFSVLLRCLSFEQILQIFASAVLERRIIFLAEGLSTLSQCIHAAAALLYPFSWAHTYIPVVPESLLDTVCCPTPFMVGVQMRFQQQVMDSPMEEVLLVNLCEGTFLMSVGDEKDILPPKLQDDILDSLGQGTNESQTSEQLNEHVSGPFVQFFVKTVGHYASYIKREANGQGHFQERAFYKALTSKTNRRFVKKFVKTQLFSLFIQEAEKSRNPPAGYFQRKILEYEEQKKQKKSREKTVK